MTSVKVNLSSASGVDSIDRVKAFVDIISNFDGEYDLASDRYLVDAKSIMGVFSLNTGKDLRLDIHNDDEAAEAKKALAAYIID